VIRRSTVVFQLRSSFPQHVSYTRRMMDQAAVRIVTDQNLAETH
jgi:hypothetical protein